ncbi:MAG TPA: TetR/AcrR family transcriptional regulator [Microbacterium sp.]|uniref:TetR/AcrR family transcriptional regulator n=1 Tax=Microbacterium sp. TaxID=51671 RepID=UPI002B8E7CAC|nr:TetR/AcrR family transcriptional regulator [Microbacterium sp.]HWI31065.1 TetR/AcrR family transcriptional regulator [Microbacterium sp.]
MTQLDLDVDHPQAKPRLGRKRDQTRDPEILDAALEVLAETGYDGMTIEMVAARAKAGKATLYRRWASKPELVLDAVACMKARDLDLDSLPDTGTLRGDLVAMVKAPTIQEGERKLKVMAGIVSMIARDPELAAAAQEALVEPRAAANRVVFRRAIERGEISADVDVETLCTIGPAMIAYRVLMLRKPVDRAFIIGTIDQIILPAAMRATGPT